MEPPDKSASRYRAPEVIYENGVFLLYYSIGNEERMRISVARSAHPSGPFIDCGVRLTAEDFAIDPHIFKDDDGTRWMFYATDLLNHARMGTETVCDRMLDAFTLAGEPRLITRVHRDWRDYGPYRIEDRDVRWDTVEGPFTLKRKGLYYQLFSGGDWRNGTYGMSYAVAEKINESQEWRRTTDGEQVMPFRQTIPGEVAEPGHSSVVRGPDNQQLFCVYHCRDRGSESADERLLAVNRLEWAGERMLIIGANSTPQPAPNLPTFADYFDVEQRNGLGDGWSCNGGRWSARDGAAWQEEVEGEAEATCKVRVPYFIAEVSLKMRRKPINGGGAGIKLIGEDGALLFFTLIPDAGQAVLTVQIGGHWRHQNLVLPESLDLAVFHHLRVEVNARRVKISIDDSVLKWEGVLGAQPHGIALITQNKPAEFAGFTLMEGWEDLFTGGPLDPAMLNWMTTSNDDRWQIDHQHLWYVGPRGESSVLTKGPVPREYELIINARLVDEPKPGICYGFLPGLTTNGKSPLLTVERKISGWAVYCQTVNGNEVFMLPPDFDPSIHQQFRFRWQRQKLMIQHEARILGEIDSPGDATMVGLVGYRAVAAFDMVMVTALSS